MKLVKISELPSYETLDGLRTIGTDSDNKSVQVPLSALQAVLRFDRIEEGSSIDVRINTPSSYYGIAWIAEKSIFAAYIVESGSRYIYYSSWNADEEHSDVTDYMTTAGQEGAIYKNKIYLCQSILYVWDGSTLIAPASGITYISASGASPLTLVATTSNNQTTIMGRVDLSDYARVDKTLESYREKYSDTLLTSVEGMFSTIPTYVSVTYAQIMDVAKDENSCRIRVLCHLGYSGNYNGIYVTWQGLTIAVGSPFTRQSGNTNFDVILSIIDGEIHFPSNFIINTL